MPTGIERLINMIRQEEKEEGGLPGIQKVLGKYPGRKCLNTGASSCLTGKPIRRGNANECMRAGKKCQTIEIEGKLLYAPLLCFFRDLVSFYEFFSDKTAGGDAMKRSGFEQMFHQTLKMKMVCGGILLALIPVLTMWGMTDWKQRSLLTASSVQKVKDLNQTIAETGEALIREHFRRADMIAADPRIQHFLSPGGGEETPFPFPEQQGIYLVDTKGKRISGAGPDRLPEELSAVLRGTRVLGLPAPADNGFSLPLAVPVRNSAGTGAGALVLQTPLDSLTGPLVHRFGDYGYCAVALEDGRIIGHVQKEYILKMNIDRDDDLGALFRKARESGYAFGQWRFDGMEKLTEIRRIGKSGWFVGLTCSLTDFQKNITRFHYWLMGISGGLILLAGFFSFLFATILFRRLSRFSEKLAFGTDQLASAASELAASGASLSEKAVEQAEIVHEGMTAIDNIADISRNTTRLTGSSREMIGENIRKSGTSLKALMELTRKMSRIEADSDQIMDIINTIDAIAFQTSLLSLNAAVEAARAGEMGAGFAIVAEEVKRLAGRSTEAAKDTKALLNAIVGRVAEAAAAIVDINKNFGDIIESATVMGEKMEAIAETAVQQSDGMGEIQASAAGMDDSIRSIAAASEESASVSEELSGQTEELNAMVRELNRLLGGR
ncbi:MAG: hypothetical protein CR990_00480 [Desulfococcus sp.]|nr:MAG: hypothetical protein CR990_00480 [Desulfococcus sp.]